MFNSVLQKKTTFLSILLFICIFILVYILKPSFLFNINGSLREFGIGYKNKTIFPLWLFSIILGILCYLLIMFLQVI